MLKKPIKNLCAYQLLGSVLVLCPCHLPLLLALLAGGVGGGAFTSFLSQYMTLALVVLTAYYLFALWMGQRLLARNTACSTPHTRTGGRDDCY
ncbi:hypothetical protein GCM10008955_30360 [Deinococcus malanensis]|uniref:Mercury resistance protein n=1 Tax=Deinococcus malanensis TaxID=1706855 RepID=A0ABQ2EZE0_9DEIO|nr:hypothetical protein [Deinococcus malanensis]GGK34231.1 hypothetical protein GCM10008955_30360 [Deinococcus malanensis]